MCVAKSNSRKQIEAVRHFNRFYTRQIGLLQRGILNSPFSLTEARVLYELARRERPTATEIGEELGLDAGYLSRMLQGFQRKGLIARAQSKTDGRRSILRLTKKGEKAFSKLDNDSHNEMGSMLGSLSAPELERLVDAMRAIERLLDRRAPSPDMPCTLRTHRPGDIGWVVQRHGALYALEYGWNEEFEALVAEVAAKFLRKHDPARERCWIAELDGEPVGSIFLVRSSATVAKLRLLLVDPKARGLGLGRRLVDECLAFARAAGYRKVTLWTNSVLLAARHIYEEAGFSLVDEQPQHIFGHDLVSQNWEITL
jgi:DNA-binding MarR family transcriptional regulator/GNAT superfamily N-acetyltransferase